MLSGIYKNKKKDTLKTTQNDVHKSWIEISLSTVRSKLYQIVCTVKGRLVNLCFFSMFVKGIYIYRHRSNFYNKWIEGVSFCGAALVGEYNRGEGVIEIDRVIK